MSSACVYVGTNCCIIRPASVMPLVIDAYAFHAQLCQNNTHIYNRVRFCCNVGHLHCSSSYFSYMCANDSSAISHSVVIFRFCSVSVQVQCIDTHV